MGRWLICLCCLTACAGCGSTSTSRSSSASSTRPAAATTSKPASTTTTTTPTTITTASTAGALPGSGRPAIVVGDKNYTEQFVLGQLYLQALAAQGFSVTLTQNIGPTEVTLQALKNGSLSLYPEYLNVFDTAIAGDPDTPPARRDAVSIARRWAAAHGLTLLAPTPFSDTGGLVVTDGYAELNHLRTIGDLRRVQTALTIGGPPQFATAASGLPALDAAYDLAPTAYQPIANGSQYGALAGDAIQSAEVQTTDGQLGSGDYTVLGDPRHVFGWGNVIPVVSTKVLLAEGPAFRSTIERVDSTLTMNAIRQLNAAVAIAQQDPTVVARQFLETHGLLSPLAP